MLPCVDLNSYLPPQPRKPSKIMSPVVLEAITLLVLRFKRSMSPLNQTWARTIEPVISFTAMLP